MQKRMPKQLLNDQPSRLLNEVKGGIEISVNGMSVAAIIINTAISIGLENFIEMVNAMHIISYQQILDLDYPANLEYMMDTIHRFLYADVIDSDWTSAYFFEFEPDINYVETARD